MSEEDSDEDVAFCGVHRGQSMDDRGKMYGPEGTALKVNGKFTATLSKVNKSTQEEVYVVDGLRMPLLGGLAIMTLQLVTRLNNISLGTKETVSLD